MSPMRKVWYSMGTPTMSRIIAVLMVVYFVALGLLTYGQNRIVTCQAKYAEASARSTAARSQVAADDRRLDEQYRATQDANDRAFDRLVGALQSDTPEAERRAAFANLVKVRAASNATRDQLAETRRRNDEARARSPVPAPPSQRC